MQRAKVVEKKLSSLMAKSSSATGTNLALLRTNVQEVKKSFEEMKKSVSSHSYTHNLLILAHYSKHI